MPPVPSSVDLVLLRALRIVIWADSDPARQVLFRNLMQARREVRMAYWLYERLAGTWAAAVLVSLYGLGYFLRIAPPATPGARVLAVAKHANAKRQIDRVASWMSPNECDRIRTGLRVGVGGLGTLLMPASWRHLRRTLRILRVI